MPPALYIETSVISYYTARRSRDLLVAAHQQVTQSWWAQALPRYEPFISELVLEEIQRGDPTEAAKRVEAVRSFPILGMTPEVEDLALAYCDALALPDMARVDGYHLAMATWHTMDYVVSWNCRHIASGRVRRLVREVNEDRGIATPTICTPEELLHG